jgi:hypothetical protein
MEKISREGLEELLSLIPGLANHEGPFGEHDICTQAGHVRMGPFIYSPILDRIISAIHRSGIQIVFEWPAWQEEAERICFEPGLLEAADFETVRRLFTLHMRKERFCEGHLADVCESGLMLRTLRRLKELRDEGMIETG